MILIIKGIPKPKQSTVFGIKKKKDGTQFVGAYPDKKVEQELISIQGQIITQLPEGFEPFKGLVRINRLHFVFPLLKTFNKKQLEFIENGGAIYKGSRPDLDNLEKGLYDALNGIVFLDDKNIVEKIEVKKYYGRVPHTIIDIEEIKGDYNKTEMFVSRFLMLDNEERINILQQIIGDSKNV